MNYKLFDIGDLLAGLVGLLGWLRAGEKGLVAPPSGTPDSQTNRIVSRLKAALSTVDESVWIAIIRWLEPIQLRAISRLLEALDRPGERESFRLIVVNAPLTTEGATDGKGRKSPGEFGADDMRVMFLVKIATLIENPDWGLEKTRDMLRTHQLAVENNVAKHVDAIWRQMKDGIRRRVCEFFGVDSLNQITEVQITRALTDLGEQIPEPEPDRGFWRSVILNDKPGVQIAGRILAGCAIALVIVFILLSFFESKGY